MRSDHSRQWKEVVEIINGKDYKSIQVEDGGYPVYGTGGEMARASDLSISLLILYCLGRKGTIDKPLLIREKYWNVDTAFGAVPDEKVLHYVYFYWHCKTIDFNVLNKGTTLPSTTKVDLLNLWIKNSINGKNKLDLVLLLNRPINQNLEAMAKQLYDYWFVQFDFPNEEGKP